MPKDQQILVTVDALVFGLTNEKRSHILLIERKNDPFKRKWAFPGGFVEENEDLPAACVRELEEETGLSIDLENLQQLGAFGAPGRDPRGRTVTIAFLCEIEKDSQSIKGSSDANRARWWPLSDLPELAFDHKYILASVYKI